VDGSGGATSGSIASGRSLGCVLVDSGITSVILIGGIITSIIGIVVGSIISTIVSAVVIAVIADPVDLF